MSAVSEGKPQYSKLAGLLLVSTSLLSVVALYALDISFLYEPKHLLGVTNTVFTAIIPLVVSFFAGRSYLRTGSSSVLLMGCGMLGFGLCAGSAGWLRELQGGANFNVTIYNTGALLGSLCHFAGAIINSSRKTYQRETDRQKLTLIPAYAAILIFAVLFSFATVQHVVPPFFIQGSGPTAVRQIVLGLAIFLYAASSLLFMNNYLRIKSDFLYWYSLCLAMLALGLFAFYIERIVGSPIGWAGRTSNYAGAIFSLIAILAAVRSGKSSGLPVEEVIAGFFVDAAANYQSLIETASDAIISLDPGNRIILWNPSAERIFGYSKEEAIGSPVFERIIPKEHEGSLTEMIEASQGTGSGNIIEIFARHKSSDLFPIEISAFGRESSYGRVSTCIIRDITERRRMEEELRESKSRLDLALRSSEMGVWHLDLIKNKRFFDDQVCNLLGLDPAEFTGEAEEFFSAVHPQDRNAVESALARTIEHDAPYETEYRAIWPDGSVHHIAARGKLVYDDERRPVRLNGLIWDITRGKQAEEALRQSRAKIDAALAGMTDAVFISDAEGRFIDFNDAFATFHRFKTKDECLKTLAEYPDILDVFTADGQLAPLDQWAVPRALRGETVTNAEYTVRRKDTGETWVGSYSFSPIRDTEGMIIGSVVVGRDVTELKLIEQELRKSRDELELRVQERTTELLSANQRLRDQAALLDLAHDAIIVRDLESRIVFWSRGAQETYGFNSSEALGRVPHDLLKAIFPMPLVEITKIVLEKGEWKGEIKHSKANGERIVVDSRWAVQLGRDGGPAGFLEVNRDITARKIAEEEFRKANRAFSTLSECNQTMVRQTEEMELLEQVCRVVADVGGYRMVWVGFAENDENKTVRPITSAGYDHGYLDQARISWADNERGRGPTGTAVRTGKIVASQNAFTNPVWAPWRSEGIRRGFASSVALPLIVDRKVIGALTIYATEPDAFDEGESSLLSNLAENLSYGISSIRTAEQRRLSEEELRVYASRLELINKELQDFAFVAAHDLQEPLRKIQTFCDIIMKRCASALDATGQEYLDRVVNSANRMRDLLRDLLQFSRSAANPEPLGKIELNHLAREAADVFEPVIKESDCRIEIGNLPTIEADESQMLRLFQNLIGNALKFRSDGTPYIKVHGKSDRKGTCEIIVEDNGIGFDQQHAELIFKPFQRLHGGGAYQGTGMGLAICRKIVERHGGTISAESEQGKGSKFVVRLPVKQPRLPGRG